MARSTTKKSVPAGKDAPPEARPYFSEASIKFLRDLKRNNRREWFEARRDNYERDLKQPMLALVEAITHEMAGYAPDHVRPAAKSVLRIYRDTRFSSDKTPYKTHLAAWWTRSGLEKTSGGGYYLQISPSEVTVAAGVYMPPKEQLFAIRMHLRARHEEFQRLIADKRLRKAMNLHEPMALTRQPKGFSAEEPASEWIRWRQWGVIASLPAEQALQASMASAVSRHFRLAQPLVDFLNEPLLQRAKPRNKPLFGLY